ncbi:MAG TPA: HEAT repeat domain-containing protein [Longimicrobiaceae bacterium]
MPRSRPRGVRLLPLAACLLLVSEAPAQSPAGVPIPPPADSTLERVATEVTVPAGFELSLFAAPPHLTYPVVLEPAGPGVLFVGTDPNLNLDRGRRRGRILRFVDEDLDGVADRYTVFADSLDSVRGLVFDGGTLYVMHSPTLSALRDTDGDGRADEETVLVRGLGFTLDDRGGDHTSNLMRLAIDGWLYIAMGDYGFLDAIGSDGTRLRMHRGGVVRVRPDGRELEIVARGTRNIYDLALDPSLRIFARDNTNNGQAWNSRLHYLPAGADAGYPALFRNFPDEIHPPLADFGAGAATTSLWIEEPEFPADLSGTLFTADWALNRIYRHTLTPRGATFDVTQEEVMSIPRAADMEVDGGANLYIASLSGGSYTYAGEHVGYVARLRPRGAAAGPGFVAAQQDEAALVAAILSPSGTRRLLAQRELLRRGASDDAVRALDRALLDANAGYAGRIAALFTLKQLRGAGAHPILVRAAADPALRAMALRALADRRGERDGVSRQLFEDALSAADPFVRLLAATGLGRIGGPAAADALIRASTDADPVVAHVARNALVEMGPEAALLRALDGGDEPQREAALHVLARIRTPGVVSALAARLEAAGPSARRPLLRALARLYHQEGPWDGAWWGNQPDTEGPHVDPVPWEESARILPLLARGLGAAEGEGLAALASDFVREGVLPRQSADLVLRLAREGDRGRAAIEALVGERELRPEALARVRAVLPSEPGAREAFAGMLVAVPLPDGASAAAIGSVAMDRSLSPELRGQALTALSRGTAPEAVAAATAAHAAVTAEIPRTAELLQPWRRFATDRRRVAELETFAALARAGDEEEKVLAWAVLVQTAALPRNPEASRTRAASLIEAAWTDPASAAPLVRAITLLAVEDRYARELAAHRQR